MKPLIVFFGTQEFAAYILEQLVTSNQYEVTLVVTQPDRPQGRNQEIVFSPVKNTALKHNLPLLQAASLKNPPTLPKADLFIVCQYGLIIPQAVLDMPKKSTLNVHASLLPLLRGASPIQTALINGFQETGITIMLMDEKMDHGPILAKRSVPIDPNDNTATLSAKLMPVTAELLLTTIPSWLDNSITPTPQNEEDATFCKLLTRDDGHLDFTKTATELYNLYRGLTPWPGIWALWENKRIKVTNCSLSTESGTPGKTQLINGKLLIGCKEGSLEIHELQLEGKKTMDVKTFLHGYPDFNNAQLT